MRRRNGPAIRDTVIWLSLLALTGFGGYWFWGSWTCVPFFLCYGVLYGSASDSRWHESGHGTAFRTSWLNDALYQLASFMNMKEPTLWRWSHARHHTDTIIVGRDREILAMRPPDAIRLVLNVFGIREALDVVRQRHPARRRTSDGRGADLHPRDRAPSRLSRGSRLGRGLCRRDRPGALPRNAGCR